MKSILNPLFFVVLSGLVILSCHQRDNIPSAIYKSIKPQYDLVQINTTLDTLHFLLAEDMYNSVKSFNVFYCNNNEYISFYDERSQSIFIFNFKKQIFLKRIYLSPVFDNKLLKVSVYTKNFDSIFITNKDKLNLLDSSGAIKKIIRFMQKPQYAWGHFENTAPPVFKDSCLFMGVRPYVNDQSLKSLREWKVLYRFDLQKKSAKLIYSLPELYQRNLFGHQFLNYNYCYNDQGNFVFSFPADTNIYETNLANYHMAYYAKSRLQTTTISPVSKAVLSNDEESQKQFAAKDFYGPVYYDPYKNRYLRIARQKVKHEDYLAKNMKRNQSIIIFNKDFKIIGEYKLDENLSANTLFFSHDGSIYIRVNAKDENALHFVRLIYNENMSSTKLVQK